MSALSKIEWTDATWNPIVGCSIVSPGCTHCYAMKMAARLEEEKKGITDDIRDVYAEAKVNAFDVKTLRTVIRLRKQDVNARKEAEAILETYLLALGML